MTTLTAADVASDLHVARYTAAGYLRDGVIPGSYQAVPNGRWLVDGDDYEAWKRSRKAAVDPHRIAPRSARSRAAQSRRTA